MDPPVRVSARANKGQSHKRILSTTLPPPRRSKSASKRAPKRAPKERSKRAVNKAQNCPARRPTSPLSPLFIRSSPPLSAQPDAVEEEEGEEEEQEEEEQEEEEEEEDRILLSPVPVSFMTRWKAVFGREALPGAVSLKYNTNSLFYHLIKRWRDSVLGKCLP